MAVKKKARKVKLAKRVTQHQLESKVAKKAAKVAAVAPAETPASSTVRKKTKAGAPAKEPVIKLFRDFNWHYHLRVRIGDKFTYFLALYTGTVQVHKLTQDKVEALYPAPAIDTPQRAVEVWSGTELPKSEAAKKALEALRAGGDLNKVDLDAVDQEVAKAVGSKTGRRRGGEGKAPKAPSIPGGVALKTICAELKVDPRIARRVLRSKKIARVGRWEFAPEKVAEVKALLAGAK